MGAVGSQGISSDGTLRSPGQKVGGWVIAGVFGFIGIASFSASKTSQGVFLIVLALVLGFAGYWPAVWVTSSGVRVRNHIKRFELSWGQIEGFRIGRRKLLPAVLIIDRVGASPQYAWAIQVTNWSMNKPDAWERRLVIELNEL